MTTNSKQNSLVIERFRKKSGAWATVPDSAIGIDWDEGYNSTIWFPIISSKPPTIRTDIRVAKFEDGQWDLIVDAIHFESNDDPAILRERFDRLDRFRYLRPAAFELIPEEDEIEEILSRIVHPKKCAAGDLLLRYQSGPVLDCVCVRSHSKAGRIKIVGDELQFSDDHFLPPTKYRKDQYRQGVQKLRAPVTTALNFDGATKTYPESPSACIPGRPETGLNVKAARIYGDYLNIVLEVRNRGQATLYLTDHKWHPEFKKSKLETPFAYQNDVPSTVFEVSNHARYLYPGDSIDVEICVGKKLVAGEVKVFIPAFLFSGMRETYFMLRVQAEVSQ